MSDLTNQKRQPSNPVDSLRNTAINQFKPEDTTVFDCLEIVQKEYETTENPLKVFEDVLNVIKDRKIHPKEGSYTNYLFDKGIDKILKKLGEEATEIVIAAKNPNSNEVKYEISDFLYHMMVLMVEKDVTWEEITKELANR